MRHFVRGPRSPVARGPHTAPGRAGVRRRVTRDTRSRVHMRDRIIRDAIRHTALIDIQVSCNSIMI